MRRKECRTDVPHLILNRRESLNMTKTTKALLAGAAFAGLFAGTGAAIKASTLLPSLKTSFGAQDQDQSKDQMSEKAKDKKDRHACKGQNSCKGKGACKSFGPYRRVCPFCPWLSPTSDPCSGPDPARRKKSSARGAESRP